ncbi:hypothetical protein [Streptomyces radiopugnans]|uniref:PknH-like extracellular domain-containing protein n=1 Tax=Streptomyces radiopugnans TaxID=403935 RepID=A0A1H9H726_9ACTN|nr:hypothetical protein [Streptomyces radiopugnans]SEQ58093.1 hypothetical protein SAMN05216481_110146 [Streptomyces radiopugnans]
MDGTAAAVRRRIGLPAAALALVLAATACGGDGGGGGGSREAGGAGPSPSSAAEEADGSAASEAGRERLEAAAFEAGGTAASYQVSPDTEEPLWDLMEYRADRAECQPLVSLAAGAVDDDPVAEVHRDVELDDLGEGPTGRSVAVQLRSYGPGGAARVLSALRRAGTECAGGFTEERVLAKAVYRSVEPVGAPEVGDEAVAYRLRIGDVKDEELVLTEYLTVVRSGSTTLSFRLEALSLDDPGPVPDDLVLAQWKAFEEAGA